MSKKNEITAGELKAQLSADPAYIERMKSREAILNKDSTS